MSHTSIGICTLQFYLPGISSLKEKRRIIKSMLTKAGKRFNASTAEVGYHDKWQSSEIAIVTVSNSAVYTNKTLQNIIEWIEETYPDAMITHQDIEII